MNIFYRTDDFLLKQHQRVADFFYTEFDISPYKIAVHLFTFTIVLGFSVLGYGLTLGKLSIPAAILGGVVVVIFQGLFVLIAMSIERRWQARPDMRPVDPYGFLLLYRWMWLFFSIFTVTMAFIAGFELPEIIRNIAFGFRDLISSIGFFMLSCAPPTRKKKKFFNLSLTPLPEAT